MKKIPVSEKCDVIEQQLAIAVMTSPVADRNAKSGIPIQTFLEDVKSCLNGMSVSFQELRVRIERWVKRGWGTMNNNIFLPNKHGRRHLRKMAKFA